MKYPIDAWPGRSVPCGRRPSRDASMRAPSILSGRSGRSGVVHTSRRQPGARSPCGCCVRLPTSACARWRGTRRTTPARCTSGTPTQRCGCVATGLTRFLPALKDGHPRYVYQVDTLMARVRQRIRRFAQKPASVDLAPFRALLDEGERARVPCSCPERRGTDRGDGQAARARHVRRHRARARWPGGRRARARPASVRRAAARRARHCWPGTSCEMATGEGKTLAGAIAAAGYALRGDRCT